MLLHHGYNLDLISSVCVCVCVYECVSVCVCVCVCVDYFTVHVVGIMPYTCLLKSSRIFCTSDIVTLKKFSGTSTTIVSRSQD